MFQLPGAGHAPESIRAEARLGMEQEGQGWKIATIALTLRAMRER
jgi:hypothetical protein